MTSAADTLAQTEAEFRRILGSYPTGVTVITARSPNGAAVGVTVNSFASLSLRPPMILWCLGSAGSRAAVFEHCEGYAVNVLAANQEHLSRRFAARLDAKAGFDVPASEGRHGAPLLQGCCAWIEADNFMRHPHGDHLLFIGAVRRLRRADPALSPLVFHHGSYQRLASG